MCSCGSALLGSAVFVRGEVFVERMECGCAHVAEAVGWLTSVEDRAVNRVLIARGLGGACGSSDDRRDLLGKAAADVDGKCDEMLSSGMEAVHLACRLARRRTPYEAGELVEIVSLNF